MSLPIISLHIIMSNEKIRNALYPKKQKTRPGKAGAGV